MAPLAAHHSPPLSAVPTSQTFGDLIRGERKRAGLTQVALAEVLGIRSITILNWEKGRGYPQERLVIRFARWADRPVADFMNLLGVQPTMATLGGRICLARWASYLDLNQFSTLVGTERFTLQGWEEGTTRPTGPCLRRLIEVIGDLKIEDAPPASGVLAWPGKKLNYLPQLLDLIPETGVYVEPFGGSATVLLARAPSRIEVYNDVNADLANLFRVLRDARQTKDLERRLSLTLWSRSEHSYAAARLVDPRASAVTRAWAYFVVMNQGSYGRESLATGNWRRHIRAGGDWWKRVSWIGAWHQRLANVQVECVDGLELLARYDDPDTTFYLDPPYVRSTRKSAPALYACEVDDRYHRRLVDAVLGSKGSVVLAGYPSRLYEPLERAGWERVGLGPDTVWRNQRAVGLTSRVAKRAS